MEILRERTRGDAGERAKNMKKVEDNATITNEGIESIEQIEEAVEQTEDIK